MPTQVWHAIPLGTVSCLSSQSAVIKRTNELVTGQPQADCLFHYLQMWKTQFNPCAMFRFCAEHEKPQKDVVNKLISVQYEWEY